MWNRLSMWLVAQLLAIKGAKHWNGLPEMWWVPHPWRYSGSGRTKPWATRRTHRCPCSSQESWTGGPLRVPSNSYVSMVLGGDGQGVSWWFCLLTGPCVLCPFVSFSSTWPLGVRRSVGWCLAKASLCLLGTHAWCPGGILFSLARLRVSCLTKPGCLC